MFKDRPHSKSIRLLFIALTLILALSTATAAYATFVSGINTDDTFDDSNWPGTPTLVDPSDAPSGYDITNVWVATDANPPTQFYFRLELNGSLPDGSLVEARLDCNGNDSFDDSVDVLVDYTPGFDEADAEQGDGFSSDNLSPGYGEVTGSGAFEWKADTSGGNVDWSQCLSNPLHIVFATIDEMGTDQDTTTTINYNVPTAITLKDFSARPSVPALQLVPIGLFLLAVSGLGILRHLQRVHIKS